MIMILGDSADLKLNRLHYLKAEKMKTPQVCGVLKILSGFAVFLGVSFP